MTGLGSLRAPPCGARHSLSNGKLRDTLHAGFLIAAVEGTVVVIPVRALDFLAPLLNHPALLIIKIAELG